MAATRRWNVKRKIPSSCLGAGRQAGSASAGRWRSGGCAWVGSAGTGRWSAPINSVVGLAEVGPEAIVAGKGKEDVVGMAHHPVRDRARLGRQLMISNCFFVVSNVGLPAG